MWIFEFECEGLDNGIYRLVLEDPSAQEEDKRLLASTLIGVAAEGWYGAKILSPLDGDGVNPSFVQNGTSTDSGVATGTMTDSATPANVYHGVQLQGGQSWRIQFNNLPATNNPYTLNVTVGSSTAPPVTNLHVLGGGGG
jgi:hypothetical protein